MKPTVREHWPIYGVALGALLLILARVASARVHERFDNTALILFALAGVALVLPFIIREVPRIKRFKYGDTEIEFRDLEQDLPSIGPSEKKILAGGEAQEQVETESAPIPEDQVEEQDRGNGSLLPMRMEEETIEAPELRTAEDWKAYRQAVKERSRNVFLAHVIKPSSTAGQKYDVFIFLVRSKSLSLDDIECAEFYFGRYWGNRIFKVENDEGGKIGISTSAYGPFLATCRITFRDRYQANVERFIDFEMGRVFEDIK